MKPLEPGIPSIPPVNKDPLFQKPVHLVYADAHARTLIFKAFPISNKVGILAVQEIDSEWELHTHSYVVNEKGNFLNKDEDGTFVLVNFPYDYYYMLITWLPEMNGWIKQDMSNQVVAGHFIWMNPGHHGLIDRAMHSVHQAYVGLLQK